MRATAGEGRGGAEPLRRPPRAGDRRVPPARGRGHRAGRSRSASEAPCPPHFAAPRSSSASSATAASSVADLARDHAVSAVTVHRDLEELAREGLVERVHGGARALGLDAERAGDPDRVDAARRPGAAPPRRRSPRTPRATSATARRSSSTRPRPRSRSRAGSSRTRRTSSRSSPTRPRSPTRCRPSAIHVVVVPGRARPAHAHARRALDGRVPGRAQLRGRVRLGRRRQPRPGADDRAAAARRRRSTRRARAPSAASG